MNTGPVISPRIDTLPLAIILVGIIVQICYLLTLQKAMDRVAPHNRLMASGLVWLNLIPCFNLIWQFFIAVYVPGSLQNEFRERRRDNGSDYGRRTGMTFAGMQVAGLIAIPLLAVLTAMSRAEVQLGGFAFLVVGLCQLILFIKFWAKIAGHSSQLATLGEHRRDLGYDPDDDITANRQRTEGPPSPPGAIQSEKPDQYP